MCQEQYNTNKRKFKQLTYKERIKIETLYNDQHLNYTEIGKILGKHITAISRDICILCRSVSKKMKQQKKHI